jgi:hypothetical protein
MKSRNVWNICTISGIDMLHYIINVLIRHLKGIYSWRCSRDRRVRFFVFQGSLRFWQRGFELDRLVGLLSDFGSLVF